MRKKKDGDAADFRGLPRHRFFGLTTMWQGTTRVVYRKCQSCSGGAQWLNPATSKWGPIPYEHRREMKDEVGFAKTNVRRCPDCIGLGKHWVPVNEVRSW
jgi:hypothetical protein